MPNGCWPRPALAKKRSRIKRCKKERPRIRMKTGRLLFAVSCLLSAAAQAADFQVSASLDRNQITLNEQAVLSLTISGSGSNLPQPQLPGMADFQIYNAGRSQNYTWVNGKASASVTYNFVLT